MKFKVEYDTKQKEGCPIYIRSEQSFLYHPWKSSDFSLMVGCGYVGLDICLKTGTITQVSGLCPFNTWKNGNFFLPKANLGNIKLVNAKEYMKGTGIQYANWKQPIFNKSNGWIFMGRNKHQKTDEFVTFAQDTIAEICDGEIVCIWIKPLVR